MTQCSLHLTYGGGIAIGYTFIGTDFACIDISSKAEPCSNVSVYYGSIGDIEAHVAALQKLANEWAAALPDPAVVPLTVEAGEQPTGEIPVMCSNCKTSAALASHPAGLCVDCTTLAEDIQF